MSNFRIKIVVNARFYACIINFATLILARAGNFERLVITWGNIFMQFAKVSAWTETLCVIGPPKFFYCACMNMWPMK